MQIQEIIWLDEVEDKIIRKHQVWPDEAEEVLLGRPHVRFMERGHRPGEDLYAAFGQTTGGRYLTLFFLLKPRNVALMITARDMTNKEGKRYGKKH
ncbi:MAG TPA: BrnT family toxin [Thermoflexia bacterium]|nr:BrnT family toxin [Thermoflexia bacterium]